MTNRLNCFKALPLSLKGAFRTFLRGSIQIQKPWGYSPCQLGLQRTYSLTMAPTGTLFMALGSSKITPGNSGPVQPPREDGIWCLEGQGSWTVWAALSQSCTKPKTKVSSSHGRILQIIQGKNIIYIYRTYPPYLFSQIYILPFHSKKHKNKNKKLGSRQLTANYKNTTS